MPEGIKVGSAFIEVHADFKHAQKEIKDFRKKAEKEEVELGVAANTAAASSQIAYAARDRLVALHVKAVGIPQVEKSLARLSGLRVITDNVTDLGKALANLDKSAPKVANVATVVTNLAAAIGAGSSNILGIAGSVASIAPAVLAVPGMFAGAAIGVGVLTAALKDGAEVLSELQGPLGNLQDTISSNFWGKAAEPIKELVYTLLPAYSGKLNEVASEMGELAAYSAGALQEALGSGVLNELLDNLIASIDQLKPAIKPIIDAFIALGLTGSAYLPILSSWLSQLAIDFNDFTQAAAADGRLTKWIDTGIKNLQHLGEVVGHTSMIFYGLYTAARDAGGASLESLAAGLSRISDVVNGPVFQKGLTTFFEGAHAGMAGLGQAMGPIGSLFEQLVPHLAKVMEISGNLAGSVLGALAEGLEKANVGESLVVMFEGISKGVEAILPAMPALTGAFGKWLETIGKVMEILGPVFGAAIEALAPVFESLLDAVLPVAEVLAGALTDAIEYLAPHLQNFFQKLADFVKNNPELATTFVIVAGVIGGIATAITQALPTIIGVFSAFKDVAAGGGGVAGILGKLKTAFGFLTGPIGLIITGLVAAYASSEPFREVINKLIGTLMDLVGSIVKSLEPVLKNLMDLFLLIVNEAVVPLVSALSDILIPVVESLMPIIETVFGFIASTIENVMTVVKGIISVVTGLIKGDWDLVWSGIKDIFSGIWNQIKNIVTTAIDLVKGIINTGITTIRVIWETVWNIIKNVLFTIWEGIKTVITNAWNGISSFIRGGVDTVKNIVSNGFTVVRDTATNLWNGLKNNLSWVWDNAIKPVFQAVAKFIKEDVPGAFEKGVNSIKTFWDRLKEIAKAPIKFMIDTVYNDGIRGVFNSVMDFIGNGTRMNRLSIPGFRKGGYTGNGGVDEAAGVVHGKEFVFTAEQTRAIGKDKLSAIASSASRGTSSGCAHAAAKAEGAAGGGNIGGFFTGNANAIRPYGAYYLDVPASMSPWNFKGAANMWNGAAGLKVKTGRGQKQGYASPRERGGGILGYATGNNIDMSPSWMRTLGAVQRRTVAAHEMGHAMGLPHNSGQSIMQPNLGRMSPTPTRNDIANLQTLFPGGSGKAGSGEGFNPLKWVADKITEGIGNMLDRIPGAGKVLDLALNVAKKMIDIGKQWAIDKVTGSDEGGASAARINPTVFDGGGMLEKGMVGIHNKRTPDKVLTDSQWNTMKAIADNRGESNGIINNEYNFAITIDASTIEDVNRMANILNGLEQAARSGQIQNLRRN